MKILADVAGEARELEIRQDGSRVVALVDGRRYEMEARNTQPGLYLLLSEGNVYECRVRPRGPGGGPAEVHLRGRGYEVSLTDPRRLRGAHSSGVHADGTARIVAAMPGKVVRVLVEAGEEVSAGAGLLVVEAMKMQNEMKSPKGGKVTAINVSEGATVNAGDVLAIVE